MIQGDDRRVTTILRDSVPGRVLQRSANILLAAWSSSTARAMLRMPVSDRRVIQATGIAIVSGAVVHAMLTRSLPPSTVGHVPLAANAIAAAGGLLIARFPEQLRAAWPDSSLRRLWKRRHPVR